MILVWPYPDNSYFGYLFDWIFILLQIIIEYLRIAMWIRLKH